MRTTLLDRVMPLWNNRRSTRTAFYRGLNLYGSILVPMDRVSPDTIRTICSACNIEELRWFVLRFLRDMNRSGRYPDALIVSPTGFLVVWRSHLNIFLNYVKRTEAGLDDAPISVIY